MPPQLALALTLLLIWYLLRRDSREEPRVSSAVWIPILWLMINGSRQVSQWWGTGSTFSAQALTDGSPIDKAAYGLLMVAAICVLARRRIQVGEIVKNNFPIVLFLLYEGLSVLWSDLPGVAFKRWTKALGDPLMILVLWSDVYPVAAITAAIKRCAYVLIPLSVLFCKYYDNLGRTISPWGASSYTGVTLDKNMFGYLLFTFGLFFAATMIERMGNREDRNGRRLAQAISILFLVMIGWLFQIADSQTAALSLAAGVAVMVASQFATVRKHLWSYAFAALLLAMVGDAIFSVKGAIVEASGRDLTFTGRTGLWETLLREPINPLLGVGYGSFWLGERLARFWRMYPNSPPIEAHNGYLEVYLNLGLIGVLLIVGVLWSGLRRTRSRAIALSISQTRNDRVFAMFGMAYSITYLLYNVTEATFQGLNFLFLIFLIMAFDYRQTREPSHPLLSGVNAARWSERSERSQPEPSRWRR